jgi:hypothetical protein
MMTARLRRSFTPEFEAHSVELVRTSGKSVGEICRDLDLTETAVRRWVAQPTSMPAGHAARAAPQCVSRNREAPVLRPLGSLSSVRAGTKSIARGDVRIRDASGLHAAQHVGGSFARAAT